MSRNLANSKIKKTIFVKNKIINFIIEIKSNEKNGTCFLIVLLLLLNNCSYQKINSSNQDFYINEITISGEKRAAFLIKKKLKNNFVKSGANPLNIIIDLKKTKDVAEKNLQNKVTKYQLGLKAQTVVKQRW